MTYPQLSSGAVAQYRMQRSRRSGGSRLEMAGGATVQGQPSERQSLEWNISYRGLTDAEAGALRNLFQSCRGRAGSFLFLDPLANLLWDSDDVSAASWEKESGIAVSTGGWEPEIRGRIHGVSNSGGGVAEIRQSLPLDCERLYALSGYFRSVEGAEVSLSVQGMTTAMLTEFVGSSWARLWLPVRLEEEGIGLTAGVRLLAGASVEVCGLQLEAQAAPGVYKASSVAGGIFDFARFGMDELVLTAEDEGSFRTEVTVFTEV